MISVLMPVYEVPMFQFKKAVDSVIEELDKVQEKKPLWDLEFVISFDGTESSEILTYCVGKKYVKPVYSPSNKGVAAALNAGLMKCTGTYVARFDADDIMMPGRLLKQYDVMERDQTIDILGSNMVYIQRIKSSEIDTPDGVWIETGSTDHPEIITKETAWKSTWFMNHPTVMMRRKSIMDIGGYNSSLKGFSEDYELWVRALLNGLTLRNLKECLHYYRLHQKAQSNNFTPENNLFLTSVRSRLNK